MHNITTRPDAPDKNDKKIRNRACAMPSGGDKKLRTEDGRKPLVRNSSSGASYHLTDLIGGVTVRDGPAEHLRLIALKVRSLVPDHRDPEAFHERKSGIEAELIRLAERLDGAG